MPMTGETGFNADMPAIWIMNAKIALTSQYGENQQSAANPRLTWRSRAWAPHHVKFTNPAEPTHILRPGRHSRLRDSELEALEARNEPPQPDTSTARHLHSQTKCRGPCIISRNPSQGAGMSTFVLSFPSYLLPQLTRLIVGRLRGRRNNMNDARKGCRRQFRGPG